MVSADDGRPRSPGVIVSYVLLLQDTFSGKTNYQKDPTVSVTTLEKLPVPHINKTVLNHSTQIWN